MTAQDKRYVIIGNGVAGTTAAENLRKYDPNCSIQLLTNEPYPLYNRVSLPRFLQGVIVEHKVMIRDFAWHEQRNISLITETFATDVNTDERVVVTEKGQCLPYDALLVATGGWANPLRVAGAQGTQHIYNFVTLDDTKTIIERMLESRTALAYGGSFISYELCDGFAVRKLHTTWLMRGPYWFVTHSIPMAAKLLITSPRNSASKSFMVMRSSRLYRRTVFLAMSRRRRAALSRLI